MASEVFWGLVLFFIVLPLALIIFLWILLGVLSAFRQIIGVIGWMGRGHRRRKVL